VIYNFSLPVLHRLLERTTETRIYTSITFYSLDQPDLMGPPSGGPRRVFMCIIYRYYIFMHFLPVFCVYVHPNTDTAPQEEVWESRWAVVSALCQILWLPLGELRSHVRTCETIILELLRTVVWYFLVIMFSSRGFIQVKYSFTLNIEKILTRCMLTI
jgi:hypothetical protein